MFFFNDECDLADDDRYDFFTLTTDMERRRGRSYLTASRQLKGLEAAHPEAGSRGHACLKRA
jgi:hypothetical protein